MPSRLAGIAAVLVTAKTFARHPAVGFRPIGVCIEVLQTSLARTGGGARPVPRAGGKGARGRSTGRGVGRGRIARSRFAGSGLTVDDDGFVFDGDGACVGSLADGGADEDAAAHENEHDDAAQDDDADDSGIIVDDGDAWLGDDMFVMTTFDDSPLQTSLPNRQLQAMLNTGYSFEEAQAFSNACSSKPILEAPPLGSVAPSMEDDTPAIDVFDAIWHDHDQRDASTCLHPFLAMFFAFVNTMRRIMFSPRTMVIAMLVAGCFFIYWPREIEHTNDAVLTNGNMLFDKKAHALDMIVDSGATKHCVGHVSELDQVTQSLPQHGGVRVGNGARLPVTAVGTVRLKVDTIREERRKKKVKFVSGNETMKLTNVLVVKGMPCRLFSTKWGYEKDGIRTHLNGDRHLRLPSGSKVPFKNGDNHYLVEGALWNAPSSDDDSLIHARLGHFSVNRINKTVGATQAISHHHCEACALNGNRKPRPKTTSMPIEYTHFGQRVSSDTCGPFPASPQGYTHAVNFVDSYTKYSATYFLKDSDSSHVLLAAQTFIADHKQWLTNTRIPGVVDEWHTDNGTEFLADNLDTFCSELGTRRSMSVPYVPQRNANAERLWGILLRPMRTMFAHSGGLDSVKETLWPFAMTQANQIHNALMTNSHDPPISPYEMLRGSPAQLDRFRVVFCDCYVTLHEDERASKLVNNRLKAVHLGWDARRRGYFVFIPELNRITTVVDIDFNEHSFTTLQQTRREKA